MRTSGARLRSAQLSAGRTGDFSIDFSVDFSIDFSVDFSIDFSIDFPIDFSWPDHPSTRGRLIRPIP